MARCSMMWAVSPVLWRAICQFCTPCGYHVPKCHSCAHAASALILKAHSATAAAGDWLRLLPRLVRLYCAKGLHQTAVSRCAEPASTSLPAPILGQDLLYTVHEVPVFIRRAEQRCQGLWSKLRMPPTAYDGRLTRRATANQQESCRCECSNGAICERGYDKFSWRCQRAVDPLNRRVEGTGGRKCAG
jgi:hypothetical protein